MSNPDRADATVPVRPIRVGVIDDHESVRLGLKTALAEFGYDLVAATASAA